MGGLLSGLFMMDIMNAAKYDDPHLTSIMRSGVFSVRVSREQMAQNRQRILDHASRLFRERGFEAVSVAEVMKAAGLTHGGFYGHFASKNDLIAQAVMHAMAADTVGGSEFGAYLKAYLSPAHRDDPAGGCPVASLASDSRHQDGAAREAMAEGLGAQIDRIARTLPALPAGERRRAAIGSWAAMVGAVILARAVDDPALSNAVLDETRAWIEASVARARV
jgi:TetR/AcrR family transcriptional repressor of nem operon